MLGHEVREAIHDLAALGRGGAAPHGPAVSAALMAIATSAAVPCWKRPTMSRRSAGLRLSNVRPLAELHPLPGDEVAERRDVGRGRGGRRGGLGHGAECSARPCACQASSANRQRVDVGISRQASSVTGSTRMRPPLSQSRRSRLVAVVLRVERRASDGPEVGVGRGQRRAAADERRHRRRRRGGPRSPGASARFRFLMVPGAPVSRNEVVVRTKTPRSARRAAGRRCVTVTTVAGRRAEPLDDVLPRDGLPALARHAVARGRAVGSVARRLLGEGRRDAGRRARLASRRLRVRRARRPSRPSRRRPGTASRGRSGPRGGPARGGASRRSARRWRRSGGPARSRRR